MTFLSEIPHRAQTLQGQIKQADADAAESLVLRDRAKAVLDREEATLARHMENGARLRRDLEQLAVEAQEQIRAIGLPGGHDGQNGGEVIQSSPSEGAIAGALVSGLEVAHAV